MKKFLLFGVLSIGTMAFAGCAGGSSTGPSAALPGTAQPAGVQHASDYARGLASGRFAHVCAAAAPGEASCHAIIRTDTGAGRSPQPGSGTTAVPAGYGPKELQGAYGLTTAPTTTNTIAIVDAYDDPNLENDLNVYRTTFGLASCTSASGCFTKVNQNGVVGSYPRSSGSWAQETSLDVDMASANCPACKILVVEANSPTLANLAAAVDTAARLGASAISNSYGGAESASEGTYAASYTHAGIAITASSGDSGYGAQSPASYGTVIATGGTSLTVSGTNRVSETVWSGAGSGCSAYEKQPTWQAAVLPNPSGCTTRVIADVAYDADPNTGVAVYDSFAYRGQSGWLVFGGTSVASPAIAAIYARAGDATKPNANSTTYPASYTYARVAYGTNLNDVTSGSNGTCSVNYLCNGGPNFDGPTGLGTPIGLTAF
ncbi:MAG: peptidase S8 [Vulcanimicrobiaceae bacterium]